MIKAIYTRKEAFALNRSEQEAILKARNVLFKYTDNESSLVTMILNSNESKPVNKVLTTIPKKEKPKVDESLQTKEELELEVIAWKGVNKYLYRDAKRKLKRGLYR